MSDRGLIRRARMLTVLSALLAGAIGVIASTQTWLDVVLADGSEQVLPVPGADAVPVLAPLSLAALALGGALTIAGRVLRYVFGALALLIGGVLVASVVPVVVDAPVSAVTTTVTETTGIAGVDAVAVLVASISATPWPAITLLADVVLVLGGAFALLTAHRWRGSDRRYRTATSAARGDGSRPHDAIDSWDDLSRGDDPTR